MLEVQFLLIIFFEFLMNLLFISRFLQFMDLLYQLFQVFILLSLFGIFYVLMNRDSFFLLFFFILNLSMTIFTFFLAFKAILSIEKARLIKNSLPILNILKLFFLFLSNIYYFPFFNLVIDLYFDFLIYCFNKLISWNYILRLYCIYDNIFLDSLR